METIEDPETATLVECISCEPDNVQPDNTVHVKTSENILPGLFLVLIAIR